MSVADELQKLEALRASGALTPEEFAAAKLRVLNGQPSAPSPAAPSVQPAYASQSNPLNAFRRSSRDYVLGGVCGGLAEQTPIPSWAWRVGFALLTILGVGTGVIVYVLMWIFVPSDQDLT